MTETIVLDVSAALPWCFEDEADADSARLLDVVAGGHVVVPGIWHIELLNVLIQAERRKRITQAETQAFLELLDRLAVETDHESQTTARTGVLQMARAHRLSGYDTTYLELAHRRGIRLATRDKALQQAARQAGVTLIEA